MKIFLLKRPDGAGYDEYDAVIVRHNSEVEARQYFASLDPDKDGPGGEGPGVWLDPEQSVAELIGNTVGRNRKPGLILGSYHAG